MSSANPSSSSEDKNPLPTNPSSSSTVINSATNPSSSSSQDINPSSSSRILRLRSSDDENFDIKESVAMQSGVLKLMIEDDCFNGEIPLSNVTGKVLSEVIDWCSKHEDEEKDKEGKEEIRDWEKKFITKFSWHELVELLLAANYLDIKPLLNCSTQRAANIIEDKSVEEVRDLFNIENDFSAEEEALIRAENKWAFE